MSQWNIVHFRNVTEQQLRDKNILSKATTIYNAIKAKRSEILEAALSVEGLVDQVLLDLLVGRDEEKRQRLTEFVLAAEFCTSFQKWKMLRRLMKSVPKYFELFSDGEGQTLRHEIKKLIEDRNKFAHGDLFVDVSQDYAVELRYYEDGTHFLRITEETVAGSLARALRCREALWKLHDNFGTGLRTTVV